MKTTLIAPRLLIDGCMYDFMFLYVYMPSGCR